MSGHAFVWRSGRVSWLYISQTNWAMVPLAGGGFLLIAELVENEPCNEVRS